MSDTADSSLRCRNDSRHPGLTKSDSCADDADSPEKYPNLVLQFELLHCRQTAAPQTSLTSVLDSSANVS